MRAFWAQIVTLSLYFEIVFVVSRLWDLVIWFQQGAPPTEVVDPLLLSVKQLKMLLDTRGVNYTGLLEKTELAQLVSDTAVVVNSEVEYLAQASQNNIIPKQKSSHFTSRGHFYEEVEDSRDSVWLIQVISANEPILDDYNWRVVCSQVEPFAIRTGVFDCRLDPRLCDSKGWKQSLLLLAMPKGTKPKDKVILRTFISKKPRIIMDWIRQQLSVWVKKVKDTEEVKKDWLHLRDESEPVHSFDNSSKTVQILLISNLLQPPLFLVALSIKFSGRVRFGMLNVQKEDTEDVRRELKLPVKNFPCYLVITPEQTVMYGKRRLEHFNFWSFNIFLRSVQPEMNDVFVGSLVLVNMLVILLSLQVFAERRWRFAAKCVWIFMVHNLMLFSTWLIVLGAGRFQLTSLLVDKLLVAVRIVSLSTCGCLIRADWCIILQHPLLFILSFLAFAFVVAASLPSDHVSERQQWWEVFPNDAYWVNCLFGNIGSLGHSLQPNLGDTDYGIPQFVERLPNIWLYPPTVPIDYLADLPIWRYTGRPISSSEESPSCSCPSQSASSPSLSPSPTKDRNVCEKCRSLSQCRRRNISLADTESNPSISDESDKEDLCWAPPPWMLTTSMCAICLETYHQGTRLCGLPCGHNYHYRCISVWILKDHHHCPICRWPAYRSKASLATRNQRLD